jgi:hypothetical protein
MYILIYKPQAGSLEKLSHTPPKIKLHADDVTSARVQSFDMFDLHEVINHDNHISQSPKLGPAFNVEVFMQTQRVIAYLLPIFISVLHNTNTATVPLFYEDR